MKKNSEGKVLFSWTLSNIPCPKKYKGRTISLNIDIMFLAVIFSLALIIATNI